MLNALARRALAAAVVPLFALLTLLASAHSARADDVRFEGSEPGLELWHRTSSVAMVPVRAGRGIGTQRVLLYEPLCASIPCTVGLALGPHSLGLSQPGGPVIETEQLNVGGPATVTAAYHDNTLMRTLGVITDLVAGAGGGALFAAAHDTGPGPYATPTFNPALVVLALVVGVGGLVTGTAMILQGDWATVRF